MPNYKVVTAVVSEEFSGQDSGGIFHVFHSGAPLDLPLAMIFTGAQLHILGVNCAKLQGCNCSGSRGALRTKSGGYFSRFLFWPPFGSAPDNDIRRFTTSHARGQLCQITKL